MSNISFAFQFIYYFFRGSASDSAKGAAFGIRSENFLKKSFPRPFKNFLAFSRTLPCNPLRKLFEKRFPQLSKTFSLLAGLCPATRSENFLKKVFQDLSKTFSHFNVGK